MKRYALDLAILIFPILAAVVAYPLLPASIPIHRSLTGVVRYADKSRIFFIALLPFFIYEVRKFKAQR